MRILAIETSCDETAIAMAEFFGTKKKPEIRVLSNIVSSQVNLHAKFGGVVPNLAKREHQKNLPLILLQALKEAGWFKNSKFEIRNSKQIQNSKFKILNKILEREPELLKQFKKRIMPLAPPKIDAIAVTYGPGLAPALWVGVNFARALAYLWDKPLIPTNHMLGHLYSAVLQKNSKHEARNPKQIQNSKSKIQNYFEFRISNFEFPAIALLVSGGHTELVLVRGHGKFKVIGETLDDAAGEAFDKAARILGLGYPGGPEISALAETARTAADNYYADSSRQLLRGQQQKSRQLSASSPQLSAFKLPRPMLNSKDYNFSFSGLKTAVFYLSQKLGKKQTKKLRPLIAKEFQDAVVEVLIKKTIRAAKEYKVKTVLLGGGVAANKLLRQSLAEELENQVPSSKFQVPDVSLTGDNALMIALAAYFVGKKKAWNKVHADANARLGP